MYPSVIFGLAIAFLAVILETIRLIRRKKRRKYYTHNEQYSETTNLDINNKYQPKWLFSYNEKNAYRKLKEIADKYNYTVFAKVRLLDLVEPRRGLHKGYFYKIQAKHVDFVLCTESLVAKYVIELDDASHDTEERKTRDATVDTILTQTGYKVLHTREITEEEITAFIGK